MPGASVYQIGLADEELGGSVVDLYSQSTMLPHYDLQYGLCIRQHWSWSGSSIGGLSQLSCSN
jgi:hypothetical protein